MYYMVLSCIDTVEQIMGDWLCYFGAGYGLRSSLWELTNNKLHGSE